MEPIETPQTPTKSIIPSSKTNWTLSFVFLIIGILIGAGGLWVYQKYYVLPKSQTKEDFVSTTPSATPDPTANWTTYTSTKYGFSIEYPVPDKNNPTGNMGLRTFFQVSVLFPLDKYSE